MKHTLATLTSEQAASLSGDNRVVYSETYDRNDLAWSHENIQKHVNRIVHLTMNDKSVFEAMNHDEEFAKFVGDHPKLAAQLSKKEFCQDSRTMGTLMSLIGLRREVESGDITSDEAKRRASHLALSVGLPSTHSLQESLEGN